MIDDLYNQRILEFAGSISKTERLEHPQASAKAHSRLCGSTIIVDMDVIDGIVSNYGQDVKACALGQATASVMARTIIGATPEELKTLRECMYEMLKNNGDAPKGRFGDFKYFAPVRDYRARHASTLLVFDAVVDCLTQIEQGEHVGQAG
ncbi:iron-sulfur cluster assembly scaffold protein [Paenochrobactrum sp. BZR 588]|uniref:iron-sulfur cluster assembly scaffold protein n=1 Tax=unclassified Paenochrobactrum TaxID=2639760 RepID=UPI0038525DF2